MDEGKPLQEGLKVFLRPNTPPKYLASSGHAAFCKLNELANRWFRLGMRSSDSEGRKFFSLYECCRN